MKQAMMEAVGEENNQAYDKPDDKPYPGDSRQPRHQENTGCDPQKRDDWVKRDFKGAMPCGFLDAQDNNAETYQHKCKQSADVG